jgi:hypothetical protein
MPIISLIESTSLSKNTLVIVTIILLFKFHFMLNIVIGTYLIAINTIKTDAIFIKIDTAIQFIDNSFLFTFLSIKSA